MTNLYIINKQESQVIKNQEGEDFNPFYYAHYEAMEKHKILGEDYLSIEEGDVVIVIEKIKGGTKFSKIVKVNNVFDEMISDFDKSDLSRSCLVDKKAKLIDVDFLFRLPRPVSVTSLSSKYPSIALFNKNGNLKQGAKCSRIESGLASKIISEIKNGEITLVA